MPTAEQKQALINAVTELRAAEMALLQASRSMSDIGKLIQVSTEHAHLDSYLSQLLHAQAAADDAEFESVAGGLKAHAEALSADIDSIKKIVDDVKLAGQIVGGIAQAASYIATL